MVERIFITGVGGPAALGTMRALRRGRVEFHVGDMDPNAAGLYTVVAERRALVLPGRHPRYVEHLLQECKKREIDVLWPTCDEELLPLARSRYLFEQAGIRVLAPDLFTLNLCLDKWALYKACAEIVPCPVTRKYSHARDFLAMPLPVILKPRRGSGSRGIISVQSQRVLDRTGPLSDYIVQQAMPGDEYSVDVFVSTDGETRVAVPRLRSKIDSGIAVTSETVKDPAIQELALRVAERVKLRGVANIQFMRDSAGVPRLLEVNPRVAGTMVLSVKAGVNLPALALDNLMGRKLPSKLSFKELAVVRMYREHYVAREDLAQMRRMDLNEWDEEKVCGPVSAA